MSPHFIVCKLIYTHRKSPMECQFLFTSVQIFLFRYALLCVIQVPVQDLTEIYKCILALMPFESQICHCFHLTLDEVTSKREWQRGRGPNRRQSVMGPWPAERSVAEGRSRLELLYRRDGPVVTESHPHPRRLGVGRLHHTVRGYWGPGALHFTWGRLCVSSKSLSLDSCWTYWGSFHFYIMLIAYLPTVLILTQEKVGKRSNFTTCPYICQNLSVVKYRNSGISLFLRIFHPFVLIS